MMNRIIRTPRKQLRLGDKISCNGQPVLVVKFKKEKDYITINELIEAFYESKIDHIAFKDGSVLAFNDSII